MWSGGRSRHVFWRQTRRQSVVVNRVGGGILKTRETLIRLRTNTIRPTASSKDNEKPRTKIAKIPQKPQTATEARVFEENKQQTPRNLELQVVTHTTLQANNDLSTTEATRSKTKARKNKKKPSKRMKNSSTLQKTARVNTNETNKR